MLPFLANAIRPPLIPGMGTNLLEQTQAFIRLVCQQKQQQLLLQQQQQLLAPHLKRTRDVSGESSPPPTKRPFLGLPETSSLARSDLVKTSEVQRKVETLSGSSCTKWTVDQVCEFVASVELCKPYVEVSCIGLFLLKKMLVKRGTLHEFWSLDFSDNNS